MMHGYHHECVFLQNFCFSFLFKWKQFLRVWSLGYLGHNETSSTTTPDRSDAATTQSLSPKKSSKVSRSGSKSGSGSGVFPKGKSTEHDMYSIVLSDQNSNCSHESSELQNGTLILLLFFWHRLLRFRKF